MTRNSIIRIRQLAISVCIALVIAGMPLNSTFAASGKTYTGNYIFENSLGRTVVPLPDGTWHKIHEELEHQDAGSGDIVSNWTFTNIYLVQLNNNNVSGTIHIRTNKEFGGSSRGIEPANFCYFEKWKYIKQESVFNTNTFCWGVRNFKFYSEPKEGTRWERATKKMEAAGWIPPFDLRGTQARYVRSDRDKFLSVVYTFTHSSRMTWPEARDWLKTLKPNIQAGFNGKSLPLPKRAIVASSAGAGMPSGVKGRITRIMRDGRRIVIGGKTYFNSSSRTKICIKGNCDQIRSNLRVGMSCKGRTSTKKWGMEFKKVECNPVSQPTPTLSVKPKTNKLLGTSTGDIESRLTKLKSLHDKGLISKDQYDTKRAEILKGL